MRMQFVARDSGPSNLVCEAEMVFDEDGPLQGMKLVGFTLWRGKDGTGVYVTFPSKKVGTSYFDFLRSFEGEGSDVKRVKSWIIQQYELVKGDVTRERPQPRPAAVPDGDDVPF